MRGVADSSSKKPGFSADQAPAGTPRSLSDLGIVGCETASAVHFYRLFVP